ncbi:MAG: tryptophan synthase subunit beta [Acidaminococcales bacterium]|jgi:tryptophan synthase beta chain|nr:tryptophan synthase subunit beta [Acidaminococcales bacterium]MDR3348095.1 tryptophan synthase subunit beta [Acidaminococcales bacterium]
MNKAGFFGQYGGQYVPEGMLPILDHIAAEYDAIKGTGDFKEELAELFKNYVGRPSILYEAKNFTKKLGGPKIYLKREDLNHTGAHKINNCLGQALLARHMGKRHVIAETGAGQHGVATATAAALFGMKCTIFMGREDVERQALNVYRMNMLGADVVSVTDGTGTLKEAVDAAINYWVANKDDIFYIIGSAVGPHPYPSMVRDFHSVIGQEAREQILAKEGRLPNALFACVGGGSNAIGLYTAFLADKEVKMFGAEAAGKGLDTPDHAATLTLGKVGVLHGSKSYVLQEESGEVKPVYSISAGLDYPGIGPEHAWLKDTGRVDYRAITDREAVEALETLSLCEGIIPALESAHALALLKKLAGEFGKGDIAIVNLSGRGDKDVQQLAKHKGAF